MLNRRLDLWMPTYALTAPSRLLGRIARRGRLTHLMFLVCDHFEPRHGVKHPDQAAERVAVWQREYANFQIECKRRFDNAPLHTWFYPPHHGSEHLAALARMVHAGLGELELHYHHQDDTAQSLRSDLERVLGEYRSWGHLLGMGNPPQPGFGFVHGDWALDNSRHGRFCGVNGELSLLQELGCWADFTMPSANEAQTRKINSIYYAAGDGTRAKSHDWGADAKVGEADRKGLFLMQGPLGINWAAPGYPRVENASLTTSNWGRADRISKWIDCQVQVKGRPEWLFIKLHAHGALEKDFDALFGKKGLEMHRVLNEKYNDGTNFKVHYVTARQAYNLARAAEDGMQGDPSLWLDYQVAPPAHRVYTLDAPHALRVCLPDRLRIDSLDASRAVLLQSRIEAVTQISGSFTGVEISAGEVSFEASGPTEAVVSLKSNVEVEGVANASIIESTFERGERQVRLVLGNGARLRYRKASQPSQVSPSIHLAQSASGGQNG